MYLYEGKALWGTTIPSLCKCASGVCQDVVPQSSISAVFTQLAGCLHSLHDAIKGEQHCYPFWNHLPTLDPSRYNRFAAVATEKHFASIHPLLFTFHVSEMSKHYNQKAGLEQELPTVTQKLLTTSECLLGSLGCLTSSTGKVCPPGGRQ